MFDPHALQPVAVRIPPCGVFVLESRHERGFRMSPMQHDFVKLVLPFSGRGWLVRRHTRILLQAGDVVVVPPGESHHLEDDGARPLSLYALCVADPGPAGPRALRHFPADEVVISTHPPQRSRWLERGVVARAEESLPLPVTHVVVDLEAERQGAAASSATSASR